MQDIFAVLFLTMTSDEAPSPWAFGLLLLLLIPWLIKKTPLSKLLDDSGHGELFLLLGILIPTAGAALFSEIGLKADLGAVVLGVLLSGHHRAGEMAKAMMSFKDLFLIGFFLSIGLSGIPTLAGSNNRSFFLFASAFEDDLILFDPDPAQTKGPNLFYNDTEPVQLQ